jgi:hypothetical protein
MAAWSSWNGCAERSSIEGRRNGERMSRRSEFKAVKYFCGLIYRREPEADTALGLLQEIMSGIDCRSAAIPFAMTGYYREEMGEPLFRRFVSFSEWLGPQELPRIKIATMGLEEQLAVGGKRSVNLDPGYISEANVVIATAKNHYHRVPLADGVYAHLEYVLKDGRLQCLPWTYPDFQTDAYLDFFRGLRDRFRQERMGK